MTVVTLPDGRFAVMHGGEIVAGPFDTNAEAWRALDRQTGQPISRAEQTSDWIWQQQVERSS